MWNRNRQRKQKEKIEKQNKKGGVLYIVKNEESITVSMYREKRAKEWREEWKEKMSGKVEAESESGKYIEKVQRESRERIKQKEVE